jgi:hypothetical protein
MPRTLFAVGEEKFLEENYFVRFEKVKAAPK